LSKLAETGPERVRISFGEVGEKLYSLFFCLGGHPDADGIFFEENDSDLCVLMDMLRFEGDFFSPRMAAFAEVVASDKFKMAKLPGNGGRLARVLRPDLRESARLGRRTQTLGPSLAKYFKSRWESCPRSFATFVGVSGTNPLADAIRFFSENGCAELARSASVVAESFYNPPSVSGYGRLSLRDASCILAKGIGFRLCSDACVVDTSSGSFLYSPFVIPLPLAGEHPPHVSEAVSAADNSFPIFDNYVVLVPFVGKKISDMPASDANFPSFPDVFSALRSGEVPCVVLGERDGVCHFVCEWTQLVP
jgi:hypothetical protein